MRLVYERPVMRAEVFRTNAYAEGCKREFDSATNYLKFLLKGVGALFFDMTQHKTTNMNLGFEQYYYKEAEKYDYTDETYFFEYSAENRNYNLYRDNDNSGYGRTSSGEVQVSGKGNLQTAGFNGGTGWQNTLFNPDGVTGHKYYTDDVVQTDIRFEQVTKENWIMSY